jgi:predicted glycogen debranching enzyme
LIEFGRAICGDLAQAERREWLVTNGLGGFASGTIAGTLTRRYHGLLVAALAPPLQRTLLVTKLDETAGYRGVSYELAANRWQDGYLSPSGYELIEHFHLDGLAAVWQYALADALLEKRVSMLERKNVTLVRYRALRTELPIVVRLRALVNYRDFHGNTRAGDWPMAVTPCDSGFTIAAFDGATPFTVAADRGDASIENIWYRNFVLAEETRRGLDDRDDNLCAGTITVTLQPGEAVTVVASVGSDVILSAPRSGAVEGRKANDEARRGGATPWWIGQLELAASQFIVARPTASDPDGKSVIAGYHWFGDWARDTMIALPGLTLATGRPEIAKAVLTAFAPFVDRGMLPNFFPESGSAPEYNTADAGLWYVEAAAAYIEATQDLETLAALWPSLVDVITCYRDGTRYEIHMDSDGAIVASAPGVQLTWMDAKIGDWVVTPRMGKPIEITALWYNALMRMAALAALLKKPGDGVDELAQLTQRGFERFWNEQTGFCYDVIDGPDGDDPTLRPNQIFSVALPYSPLSAERQRGVVDACGAQLLTSHGLRTLAPSDPRFTPRYEGNQRERDAAYHQGTVWPWLLGPFAIAYARVHGDRAHARTFLEPMADQLFDGGLGTISELADATGPFAPRGAIAQAWSVAELLRAWKMLS